MRLHHQALTVVLAAACLCGGGCARLLGSILAPQEAAMSAASGVADSIVGPSRNELVGMTSEVERLLSGKAANAEELHRIKEELGRRLQEPGRGDAAQDDPERLRPWHPRAPTEERQLTDKQPTDEILVGTPSAERGLARHGPLPDGIHAGDLRAPLDLSQIRFRQR